MDYKVEIISENNWWNKAGAFVDKKTMTLHLPMKHILVSMKNASHCVETYNEALPLDERMLTIQTLSINLRNADKAYFQKWSEGLIEANISDENVLKVFNNCNSCLRKKILLNDQRLSLSSISSHGICQ